MGIFQANNCLCLQVPGAVINFSLHLLVVLIYFILIMSGICIGTALIVIPLFY